MIGIKKNKKINGFTILEVVISMTILAVCLPSILSITTFIAKSKNFNKTTYLAVLECRNVLEGTKKLVNSYGTDFITAENNKGVSIRDLLLTTGYEINTDEYYFGIAINEVEGNGFNLKIIDNSNIDFNDNISFTTNNKDMLSLNNLENETYNLVIEEVENGFVVLENNSNAIVDTLPLEINIINENTSTSEILNIKLINKNIEDKKVNIYNITNENVYLNLVSTSQHNLSLENINYTGNGNLILDTRKENIKKSNYILTVSVFDKEYKLLKRLGTLI